MKQKSLIVAIMAVCCCFLAVNANAFTVDFTNSDFSAANGQSSWFFPSYGIGVSAWTYVPWNPNTVPSPATITWNSVPGDRDGFGVTSSSGYEYDEIEIPEVLKVGFAHPVYLNSFTVSDLFNEGYLEKGAYNLKIGPGQNPSDYSGWIYTFKADSTAWPLFTNGEKTIVVNQTIYGIGFTAAGQIECQNHEFSLKGIEYTAVPEPTTLLLLGLGLIGVAYVRRTLKK